MTGGAHSNRAVTRSGRLGTVETVADGAAGAAPAAVPLGPDADAAEPRPGRRERLLARLAAARTSPRTPGRLLGLVCTLSVGARVYHLDIPTESRPTGGFVFDEKYYVNAARVIARVGFPAADTYHGASPAGTDPNGEHPQLGKLVIAAGIRIFGDGPVGWRIGAVLFGTLAILTMFWLVRAAGGTPWLALGAASLMAVDNLEMLHGRIGVLDVYCLPLMLAGVALFLQRRWLLAGVAIGVGSDMKLFALYALVVIVLLEGMRLLRWWRTPGELRVAVRRRRAIPLAGCVAATVVAWFGAQAVLDHYVPAYHDGRRVSAELQPWKHVDFMLFDYGSKLTSPSGPKGIASYPWQWWVDVEPANYFATRVNILSGGETVDILHPLSFNGIVNPVILVLALPALGYSIWLCLRRRDDLSFVTVAWYAATWLPPEYYSARYQRTEYLYYMVVILPGVFLAVARLMAVRQLPRVLLGVWIGLLLAGFCALYPFRSWADLPRFFGFS